jgi:hypothetical protein
MMFFSAAHPVPVVFSNVEDDGAALKTLTKTSLSGIPVVNCGGLRATGNLAPVCDHCSKVDV